MKKYFLMVAGLLLAAQSQAYITGLMGPNTADPNIRTHIFIVGDGGTLGTELGAAASAKAKKYRELYPKDQIYLISVNETGKDEDVQFLAEHEFDNLTVKSSSFRSSDVLNEMMQFNKIASVDVFSHSVAYYGVILDGSLNRLDPKKDGYEKLKGHFTDDAYAFLHGCNGGQFLAQVFSSQWEIPVAGSLTGTDFQYVFENKQFYNDDQRHPPGLKKETVNRISYDKNIGCYQGACLRMFPDNYAYHGMWGEFNEGGLGFYKWFCKTGTPEHCYKTMARAVLSYVSVKPLNENSSLEDYKDVVLDYLCPEDRREVCRASLESAIATGKMEYDPFQAKSLQCDFKGCQARFTCQRIAFVDLLKSGSCKVENLRKSNKTTTIANEYSAYLKGYKLLQDELTAASSPQKVVAPSKPNPAAKSNLKLKSKVKVNLPIPAK